MSQGDWRCCLCGKPRDQTQKPGGYVGVGRSRSPVCKRCIKDLMYAGVSQAERILGRRRPRPHKP